MYQYGGETLYKADSCTENTMRPYTEDVYLFTPFATRHLPSFTCLHAHLCAMRTHPSMLRWRLEFELGLHYRSAVHPVTMSCILCSVELALGSAYP